jgi:hypothetical protein
MSEITRETFEQMDTDSKLNVLFDYVVAAQKSCSQIAEETEKIKIQSVKWGSVGGVLSAIGAFLAYMFIGHISKP